MVKEIKIEDWNKKPILSKINFSFFRLYKNSVTYITENTKYIIYAELEDRSELVINMTANEIWQECQSFKIEQVY